MKTNRLHLIIQIILIIIILVIAIITYPMLPEKIATHRNLAGEPDGWGNKLWLYIWIPLATIGVLALMKVLPAIDPKKEKYQLFYDTYLGMQSVFVGFFTYLFAVCIYSNLYDSPSISFFMLIGVGLLFILIWNYMGKIRQNYFVWIKTPWTLSDETVRNKTHRLAWRLWVIGGLLFIIEAFVMKWVPVVFGIVIISTILIPVIYSYMVHKKTISDNIGR